MMQARIDLLRDKLARATLIDPSQFPKDEVTFGATVRVKDLNFNDEEEFTLVGAGEEDYDTGKILLTSPLGQGLVSKKVGDRAEIVVPQGTLRFEILEIRPAS
jgi:transcription elongation factor GreA